MLLSDNEVAGMGRDSQLCSRHFEDDCFITKRVHFHDEMEIPTMKHLKPDAVPTILMWLCRW